MSLDSPRDDSLLCFRVLRLSKPEMYLEPHQVKIDFGADMREGVNSTLFPDERSQLVPEEAFAMRVEGGEPGDAFGIDGCIELPRSIGSVYLGETISCYVSLSNVSTQVVSSVAAKVEVQSERSRVVVFDQTSPGMPAMAPGKNKDFIVHHDVKEAGPHTLICSTQFTQQEGERKHNLQYFRFTAQSPLSLRTRVRSVRDEMYLEACLENAMEKPLVLEYVRFEPTEMYNVEPLKMRKDSSRTGPLKDYINSLQIVQPQKGTMNFIFKFSRVNKDSCPRDESRILGRMEIMWKGALGQTGRLQTQQILGGGPAGVTGQKDIYGKITYLEDNISIYKPFKVVASLWNASKQAVGPLSLVVRPGGEIQDWDLPVQLHGVQSTSVATMPPNSSCEVSFKMIASEAGVRTIGSLVVVHETDGFEFGSIAPHQVYVQEAS